MADSFQGKIVLVAGGTGALGTAVASAFLAEGAETIVTYRRQEEFSALKKQAGSNESSLAGYSIDVTDEAAVGDLIEDILAQHSRIDVLVNAVGAYAGGTTLWETEPAIFDQMLALNLRSGFNLCRGVVPAMLRQRSGAVVNIASRAAVDHAAGATAYAASKAAAIAMIDCLAADLKGTGVRANSVLPSVIDTQPNRRAMPKGDFSKWPKPDDIARVILYLCSDAAKLVHGASIPVYGND
jgi:NAD(P)-dependent dehydrogenase (short-subunit alcohol dehydrogenase family)